MVVLDVAQVTPMVDYFVIASGDSSTQVRAISEAVRKSLKEHGEGTPRKEGDVEARWVLLDYGDVVVHVFSRREREYYDLDRLWADARRVDWASISGVLESAAEKSPAGLEGKLE